MIEISWFLLILTMLGCISMGFVLGGLYEMGRDFQEFLEKRLLVKEVRRNSKSSRWEVS